MKMRSGKLVWLVLLLFSGCAHWTSPPPTAELAALPVPKLAPDSVVFEVTFVRIPEDQEDFTGRFWQEADETVLPPELRRRLGANGFRCGLIGSPIPAALQEVLDQQPVSEPGGGIKTVDPGREVVARTQRLRSRQGYPGKIVVRNNPVEKLAALTYHDDGCISGESLEQAQFFFTLTSFPQGDGQVKLELIPTIEYGQPRSRYRGANGVWTVDNTSRDLKVLEDMKIDALLSSGGAVALTCTGTQRGLGDQFFGADPVEKQPRLLLVVRLQQTQMDDRFEDQQSLLEPVASVTN